MLRAEGNCLYDNAKYPISHHIELKIWVKSWVHIRNVVHPWKVRLFFVNTHTFVALHNVTKRHLYIHWNQMDFIELRDRLDKSGHLIENCFKALAWLWSFVESLKNKACPKCCPPQLDNPFMWIQRMLFFFLTHTQRANENVLAMEF